MPDSIHLTHFGRVMCGAEASETIDHYTYATMLSTQRPKNICRECVTALRRMA